MSENLIVLDLPEGNKISVEDALQLLRAISDNCQVRSVPQEPDGDVENKIKVDLIFKG